eukprot:TRINITY_DN50715_c0_g1_i1.p1 TRINITY_DN50715_c0_g1~~TRINITY_DN50715_c0_g1_i1.p1  ORF type:complete len:522 (+),score=67.34 TRINITY_DN50715_c0_g1_i1:98-1663(+)
MRTASSLTAVVPFEYTPEASVAPKVTWDPREDNAAVPPLPIRLKVENTLLIALAVFDNCLCYAVFFAVRGFHGRLYNIVDLHFFLLPGIDVSICVVAVLGTACFILMIVLVECLQLPLFHEIMNVRLFVSALPSSILTTIILWISESTETIPFCSLLTSLCFAFAWCLHMRVHYSWQLNVLSKIALDTSGFLAFFLAIAVTVLYISGGIKVLTNSEALECPFAENVMMPVQVLTLNQWHCAEFGRSEAAEITRTPANTEVAEIACSDSFVSIFGVSIESFTIKCPAGCLRAIAQQSLSVIGCGIYAVDSSVCAAAIHNGVLTDAGGTAVVYGRLGVPKFERCSRNSIVSKERRVAQAGSSVALLRESGGSNSALGGSRRLRPVVPVVVDTAGTEIPQAFHFNNEERTREFLWLKRFAKVSSRDDRIQAGKPWTRVDGVVSLRLAGVELEDEEVRLGDNGRPSLFQPAHLKEVEGEASPASASSIQGQPECTVQSTGVRCRGAGAAVLRLDFCQPDVMSCPA